jgi:hypothetical protein
MEEKKRKGKKKEEKVAKKKFEEPKLERQGPLREITAGVTTTTTGAF